ncbi:MAG TPA: EamA family transporter [Steroidobacteraceae bacterium]|nr:EamA family transporter [Steroidobacteraceae bacterium]
MSKHSGAIAALSSALLFGVTTPVAKQLLSDTHPLLIAGLLYLGSGLGVSALRMIQDQGWRPTGLTVQDWPWLGLSILLGGIAAPALLMTGLAHADAAVSSLLLNLEVVFTAALAWLVFREPASSRVVVGLAAIFAGGLILVWPSRLASAGFTSSASALPALGAIVTACACWAIDNNVTRKVSAGDARVLAAIKGLVAGATSTTLAFSLGASLPAWSHVLATMALGFLGYGLSLVLFIVGLRQLGTARTGAYFATAPFIGAVVAMLLFGQPSDATFWLAAACMGIGVWLHVSEHHEHEHVHEPMSHSHAHSHDEHHRHEHGFDWDGREPHTHEHRHGWLRHSHAHFPDIHHRHGHRHV